MRAAECQHGFLEQVGHHAGQGAYPELLASRGAGAADAVGGLVEVPQHPQRVAQEALAKFGQVGPGTPADQQTCVKQRFQLAQRLGYRGLAQSQLLTGQAQVLGLRHRDETMQVAQADAAAKGGLHSKKLSKWAKNSIYSSSLRK